MEINEKVEKNRYHDIEVLMNSGHILISPITWKLEIQNDIDAAKCSLRNDPAPS